MDNLVKINSKAFDALIAALSQQSPQIRVGILGDKNARAGKENSNATIGAIHEYGAGNIPQRSFLRVPLQEHMADYVEKAQGLDDAALKEVVRQGTVVAWMKKIAVVAETVVMDAFRTSGFGKWAPHAPGYENNTGQVLVDTQQLRNSITSEVK